MRVNNSIESRRMEGSATGGHLMTPGLRFLLFLCFLGALAVSAVDSTTTSPPSATKTTTKSKSPTTTAKSSASVPEGLSYWLDPDTPSSARTTRSEDGDEFVLVASDEFEQDGRRFDNGQDKMFTALDTPDITNDAQEYIHPSAVTTGGGSLRLSLFKENRGGRAYVGGHVQSWNKFCFTEGIIKIRAKWPDGGGVWPAAWMLGNLCRAQYERSCEGTWPWSYDRCDASAPHDGDQKFSACSANPGKGLHPYQGRGAPEMDLIEAWPTGDAFFAASLQTAPHIPFYYRPDAWNDPITTPWGRPGSWYHDVTYGDIYNRYYGHNGKGYYVDAISGMYYISSTEKESWNEYTLEYKLGDDGFMVARFNNDMVIKIPQKSIGRYEDPDNPKDYTNARLLPEEPMTIILNLALGSASSWAGGVAHATLPSVFQIDYVRVYQNPNKINVGCDPPDFPTKTYIEANQEELYGPAVQPVPPANSSYFHYAPPTTTTTTTTTETTTTTTTDTDSEEGTSSATTPSSGGSEGSDGREKEQGGGKSEIDAASEGFVKPYTLLATLWAAWMVAARVL